MTAMFRVRLVEGTEGDVLHVQLGEYTTETSFGSIRTTGFVGLLQLDDGTLTTRTLEGAAIIRRAPVAMPVPGPGSGR